MFGDPVKDRITKPSERNRLECLQMAMHIVAAAYSEEGA